MLSLIALMHRTTLKLCENPLDYFSQEYLHRLDFLKTNHRKIIRIMTQYTQFYNMSRILRFDKVNS